MHCVIFTPLSISTQCIQSRRLQGRFWGGATGARAPVTPSLDLPVAA